MTILNHWKKKDQFGGGTSSMVDWEFSAQAMSGMYLALQLWVSKAAT